MNQLDLIGGTPPYAQFDLLPGNGFYVDLCGSDSGGHDFLGCMLTNEHLTLTNGYSYTLKLGLAGNQRANVAGFVATATVYAMVGGWPTAIATFDVTIDDYLQDFIEYSYTFTVPGGGGTSQCLIEVKKASKPTAPPSNESFGTLLGWVELDDDGTSAVLFYDDFDAENFTVIDPCPTQLNQRREDVGWLAAFERCPATTILQENA